MAEKVKYIQLDRRDATIIIGLFHNQKYKTIKVNVSDFPSLSVFPEAYASKVSTVTVSLSGSEQFETTTFMCLFHRVDGQNIDQDCFGFYVDYDTSSPSLSGCMIYHGDWDERTQNAVLASKALDSLPENITIDLEDCPHSIKNAFGNINEKILIMREIILNDK